MYVGYISTAGAGVLDTFSNLKAQPYLDVSQDIFNTNIQVDSSGKLSFSFVRNFITTDTANDYQIVAGDTVTVGWALGGGAIFSGVDCEYDYHGKTNRGSADFNLIATAYTTSFAQRSTVTSSPFLASFSSNRLAITSVTIGLVAIAVVLSVAVTKQIRRQNKKHQDTAKSIPLIETSIH
jgi:hypothetical protein